MAASHSDLGEAHEPIEIDYNEGELQVGFNYQYLLDFLTTTAETQISFEFKDSESAAQLKAVSGPDYSYRYVVMPSASESPVGAVYDRALIPLCCANRES